VDIQRSLAVEKKLDALYARVAVSVTGQVHRKAGNTGGKTITTSSTGDDSG